MLQYGMEVRMKINELIELDVLQSIQDNFAKATGFAVIMVDYKGNPLLKYSGFTAFCSMMREDDTYLPYCLRSDAFIALEAVRSGEFNICKCHAGLIDFSIPIIVNDQYIGSMMCGQVRTTPDTPVGLSLSGQSPDFSKNKALQQAFEAVPIVSYEQIVACAQLFQTLLNSIVEKYALKNTTTLSHHQTKAIEQLEKERTDLEIKYYTAQLNPHFLFNALNAIGRQANLEGADKTVEIIYSLADMLRQTLVNAGQLITIEQEFSNISNYLFLQSVRFGEQLKFELHVVPDAWQVKVPALLILNLVENAVSHGLESKEGQGTLCLDISVNQQQLHIVVKDDGIGILPSDLALLNQPVLTKVSRKNTTGLGILNTKKRLAHFFANQYTFEIVSEPNKGTTVAISLPVT